MVSRTDRLKKLVEVQEQLKALHEARRASHLKQSSAAAEEAADLARRADVHSEITAAFPDLYNRRIDAALTRQARAERLATREAQSVTAATLKANTAERAHKQSARQDERTASDKERLEIIQRLTTPRK